MREHPKQMQQVRMIRIGLKKRFINILSLFQITGLVILKRFFNFSIHIHRHGIVHVRCVFGFLNLSTVIVRPSGKNLKAYPYRQPILLKLVSASISSGKDKLDAIILPKEALNQNIDGCLHRLSSGII
jgi:hypothetical protein